MDNQYSYYHSDDNYQYGGGSGMNTPGQGRPDHHAKEPKKKAGNGRKNRIGTRKMIGLGERLILCLSALIS